MKSIMKLALATASLTLAVVAAPAFATETAPAAETQAIELKDGTKVEVKGEDVFVLSATGEATPAPDGDHVTSDGKTITTKGGKLVK